MPSPEPEHETLSHITSFFMRNGIISSESDLRMIFCGRKIDTDEALQDIILNDHAGDKDDPINIIFKQTIVQPSQQIKVQENSEAQECSVKKKDIIDVFQSQVEKHALHPAATYDDEIISYGELDKRANQLAQFLSRNYSISPNTPIAIVGSNKLQMLICEIAILKCGGCFVPFDTETPKKRLEYTLNNSQTKLMIACDTKSAAAVSDQNDLCPLLNLAEQQQNIALEPSDAAPPCEATPEDLAYILYTSGSTSTHPKGVMQTRGGLLGQIQNYTQNLKISPDDHILQLAPLTHDQAVVDIYAAMLNGSTLHFCDMDADHLDPIAIRKLIQEKEVTIFSSIPSIFSLIFEGVDNDISFPFLRIITLGGEAVKNNHVRLFQKIAPSDCLFINGYGATEFSWISYFVIHKHDSLEQMSQIPLGLLANGTTAYLDLAAGNGQNIGELCVHSPWMSPGYWQNSEATSKSFFTRFGKKYYRTGDLARKDSDNVYHFEGRLSWHEKINGKRINLRDIEICMLDKFPVEECVVISHGEEPKRIYAFYTSKEGESFDQIEMRKELGQFLKVHEIPFKFYHLSHFPLLHNAKIDRHALKAYIESDIQTNKEARDSSLVEMHIVDQLFCEILDLDAPLAGDYNVRNHGASSIDIARFTNKLNDYLATQKPSIYIGISDIQSANSINDIKELIETKKKEIWIEENLPCYEEQTNWGYNLVYDKIYRDNENTILTFNFPSLQILADYYNQKHGINIAPCKSHEDFIHQIESFIAQGQPGQIGLTLPRNNHMNGHPTACIFHLSEEKNGSLFLSDSTGHIYSRQLELISNHQFPCPMQLYIDPCGRQHDEFSCSLDVITYLKDALRLDMPQEIKILSEQNLSNMNIGGYSNVLYYQSPCELLKHSQSRNFPDNLPLKIDLDIPLKTSKRNISLMQYRKEHVQSTTYVFDKYIMNSGPTDLPPIVLQQNNSLYHKGKKYKTILYDHK